MNMIFDYKRPTVTIYGKSYEIPTKTAFFVTAVTRINKSISEAADTEESVRHTIEGICLYLGEDFVREHYGDTDISRLDTDEVGALWLFLNRASAQATREVLNSYAKQDNTSR